MGSVQSEREERKEICLSMADKLFHYKWIAAAARIDEDTLKNWRDEDKEFSDKLEEGRSRFINNNMRKARPDFLLETADRQIFGNKQTVEITTNPVAEILKAAGLSGGESNDRKEKENEPD